MGFKNPQKRHFLQTQSFKQELCNIWGIHKDSNSIQSPDWNVHPHVNNIQNKCVEHIKNRTLNEGDSITFYDIAALVKFVPGGPAIDTIKKKLKQDKNSEKEPLHH